MLSARFAQDQRTTGDGKEDQGAASDGWEGWEPECVGAVQAPRRRRDPRVLLVATLRWPLAARLAIAFRKLGCTVQAWCPEGHPLHKTRAVEHTYPGSVLRPQRSLMAAISAAAPDFVIPCDDDAALHLQRLHQHGSSSGRAAPGDADAVLKRLLERSLGSPAGCALATNRDALMRLAAQQGVRIPPSGRLAIPDDLDEWATRYGFPAVLKLDHSWGGQGVAIVADIDQAHCALQNAMRPLLRPALMQWLLRRDPSQLLRRFRSGPPAVTVQKLVVGHPANRAVACWQGEVLAGISVSALQTQGPTGPATVVQIIDSTEMSEAAIRMVRALGLSGFCGLDFVIEASTGAAYMIEVNPRATPISHLASAEGLDLPAALHARLLGEPPPVGAYPADASAVIAMFPGEWRRNQASPYLRTAFHDVPWAEIDLVNDCLEPIWEQRGLAARIRARLWPARLPGRVVKGATSIEHSG